VFKVDVDVEGDEAVDVDRGWHDQVRSATASRARPHTMT
jgi:hypothetical protein